MHTCSFHSQIPALDEPIKVYIHKKPTNVNNGLEAANRSDKKYSPHIGPIMHGAQKKWPLY